MEKKVGRTMGLMMGLTMSFILSLAGTLLSGHFTVVSFLLSFALSATISVTIGMLLPMKKISDAVLSKLRIAAATIKARVITSVISTLIYTPIIVFAVIMLANVQLDKQVEHMEKELADTEAEVVRVVAAGEMDKMPELQEKIGGLSGAVKGIKESRPTFAQMYLRSWAISSVLSFLCSFILSPIYQKIVFKKYGLA